MAKTKTARELDAMTDKELELENRRLMEEKASIRSRQLEINQIQTERARANPAERGQVIGG